MPCNIFSRCKMGVAAVLLPALAELACGATLYVAPPGQSTPLYPYQTDAKAASSIQVAVDAASDGDIVEVLPGTYYLTSEVKIEFKGVTVRSRGGRKVTIVDAQRKSRAFYMNSIVAKVQGFTIRNGVATPNPLHGDSYGGGVYIEDGGTVSDCIIDSCIADYGGGVRIRLQGLVENSLLRWNYAQISGGGIQTAYGGSVNETVVRYNTALEKGGGIYCFDGGEINACTINNNQAWYGGGVRLYYEKTAKPKISRSRIFSNKTVRLGTSSGAGGGVQIELGGTAENCLIYDNESEYYGGGVHVFKAGTVMNCTIAHNGTKDTTGDGIGEGLGGGLFTSGGATLQNTIIFDNTTATTPNRNLDDTTAVYRNCLTFPSVIGNGNLSGLPGYVDGAARNYTLKPTSPCIDTGYNTGAPTNDFSGMLRPLSGNPGVTARVTDIGAYEYLEVDDFDGDGMPTWWELLHGLDPNSAADKNEDPDLDGLLNIEEYLAGTDPRNPDTDGDGLRDGDEVHGLGANQGFITSPIKVDTDGDGFWDKYEIENNSDPTNALSFLTTLSGTISYAGTLQTNGPVTISVVSPGMSTRRTVVGGLGFYSVTNVPTLRALTVTAYRDGNTNSLPDAEEPIGAYAGNPLTLSAGQSGVDIVLYDSLTDTDSDGLPDYQEIFVYFTDPTNPDTDGDGMKDGWEVLHNLDPLVDDADLDPDGDGLTNLQESQLGTNPHVVDTDGDGMPDGWEAQYPGVLDPLVADGLLDFDGDGLSNLDEYLLGTIPNNPDTDGDGMKDGWEAQYMPALNPLVNDAAEDPDFDDLSNLEESVLLTDPTNSDTDGDGMPDGWEAQFPGKLDPLVDDSALDWDDDGLTNLEEYLLGTGPTNPDSDGDGVNDGDEMAAGTDPLDPLSFPVTIAGSLTYSGIQTGLYYVVASQVPTGSVYFATLTNAGPYAISNAANSTSYRVLAYLDSNGNATQDTWEAMGTLNDTNGVPLVILLTNQVSGADITLDDPSTDSDGDGLSDYDEMYVHGTDPFDPDTDGDGMPDGWEVQYPNACDPLDGTDWTQDFDSDGLKNLDEYFNNTNPEVADTDGDGLSDGEEVFTTLTDPTLVDTDGDGLTDYEEVIIYLTNPTVADTDGDGVNDGEEVAAGTDPLDGASFPTTISGLLTYVGTQTGVVYVTAVDLATNVYSVRVDAPGMYSLTNLPTLASYVVSAYLDFNGDQVRDTWEAQGLYTGNPVALTNVFPGADIQLEHPVTDTDGDGLSDFDEVIVHETDPTNVDTDGDGMPDGWEVQYAPALNPLLDDASDDPDGDGLTNFQEYVLGTNPIHADTDGDGASDGREAAVGSDPFDADSYPIVFSGVIHYGGAQTGTVYLLAASAGGVVSNALTMTGTSLVYSVSNLISWTDYTVSAYRDSNGNELRDTWEAAGEYTNNPVLQATNALGNINVVLLDSMLDSDGDGVTDYEEVYVYGTDPGLADTDGDGMPDGWEVQNGFDPLTDDAAGDPDGDLLSNLGEYQAGTDPHDPDSDNDGMPDGWEVLYAPSLDPLTDDAGEDPDGDGLTNLQEYGLGTNPTKADTDDDGMPDDWEVLYAPALDPTVDDAAGDADGDGLSNLAEYTAGTNPTVPDTDVDGHYDGFEVQWKSDPLLPASFPISITGTLINAALGPQTGVVYVVVNLASNGNTFATFNIGSVTTAGPQPPFSLDYVPTLSNYWIWAFMDLNGNSTYESWEPRGVALNGTNSVMPTNNVNVGILPIVNSTLDSDGDLLNDFTEVTVYGTDPYNPDTDSDGFTDYDEIKVYKTDPLSAASFPAAISGAISYAGTTQHGPLVILATNSAKAYTSSFGNYAAGTYSTATNLPTLTNYYVFAYIDSNTNGLFDVWEASGMPTSLPIALSGNVTDADIELTDPSGDADGDGLSDSEEYFEHFTDPFNSDTDGDGMPDGWEVQYNLDPLVNDASDDVDGDLLTNLEEYLAGTDPTNPDTDGDGLTDYEEVKTYFTDPLLVDTDGDGMPDGWEVQYLPALDPLSDDAAGDPDGDLISNLQEYGLGTDPTNADTDGDGLNDYDEAIVYETDPTVSDTDGDGFSDYDEVVSIGSDPLNVLDPVVVDDDAPDDPVPNDPNNTNYSDENGTLEFPYDSIQQAVDAAQPGFTVLVLDGAYKSTGNGNINPAGKALTIRSLNGYAFTEILQDSGNGFILNTGEGTNTVIQGFTIRTSVDDLGSAGVLIGGSSPTIRECRFYDCGEAGVYVRGGGQPQIEDCLFEENEGAIKIEESSPRITRCTMRFNEDDFGGGLWITGTTAATSQPVIVNSLIVKNKATDTGGGVYVGANARPIFVNTTIADNTAIVRGGGIFNAGDTKFWNVILWRNTSPAGPGFALDRAFETSYSCMQTPRDTSIEVFVADPKFAGANDYSLLSSSPCIDRGTDNIPYAGAAAPTMDINLNTRVIVSRSPGYDVGAFEYQPGGALFVQSPGGVAGTVVAAGVPAPVSWTYDGVVGTNLTLEYTYQFLTDPGLTWSLIASNVFRGTGGTGSYSWTVPATNTSRCYVRVVDASDAQVVGTSAFAFGITNGIRLYAPVSGGVYYLGQTASVVWASSPTTNTTVEWALSMDGLNFDTGHGAIVTNVAHTGGGVTNTGSWVFGLRSPSFLTSNGLIRVSAPGLRSGVSDAKFAIRGLVITSPGGGGNVQTGSTVVVRWTSLGAGPHVNILYSDNGGGSFVTVSNGVANVAGTNAFSWTVPGAITTNAILRIESLTDLFIVGQTLAFEISNAGGSSINLAGDGIPDTWKIAQGLDPENLEGGSGANDDPDGDGASNYHEWQAGTEPLDSDSYFGLLSITPTSVSGGALPSAFEGVFTLRWKTIPGRRYFVETTTQLDGEWADVSGELVATGSELSWTDDASADKRYYRISVLVAPF